MEQRSNISENLIAISGEDLGIISLKLIICGIGLIGNIGAIVIILVLKDYTKSITHWYVLQLAIADLIYLITIPFDTTEDIYQVWIYPNWLCTAKETFQFLNYSSSVLFLMVMSFDRYIAVCHHFSSKWQQIRKFKSALIITLITWLIALILTFPIMIYSTSVGLKPNCRCYNGFPSEDNERFDRCVTQSAGDPFLLKFCDNELLEDIACRERIMVNDTNDFYESGDLISGDLSGDFSSGIEEDNKTREEVLETGPECSYNRQPISWKIYLSLNLSVLYLLPILCMTIFYGLIVRHLYLSNINLANASQASAVRSKKRQNRVVKTVAVLVITFAVCRLPMQAVHLAKFPGIKLPRKACAIITDVSFSLAYLNSALNPFLYTFLGIAYSKKQRLVQSFREIKDHFTFKKKNDLTLNVDEKRISDKTNENQNNQQQHNANVINASSQTPSTGLTAI